MNVILILMEVNVFCLDDIFCNIFEKIKVKMFRLVFFKLIGLLIKIFFSF